MHVLSQTPHHRNPRERRRRHRSASPPRGERADLGGWEKKEGGSGASEKEGMKLKLQEDLGELEGVIQDSNLGWALGKSKTVWEETTEEALPDLVSFHRLPVFNF